MSPDGNETKVLRQEKFPFPGAFSEWEPIGLSQCFTIFLRKFDTRGRIPMQHGAYAKAAFTHLYLGCIFAPMLLFFAISGIWQTLGIRSHLLQRLSTIHTMHMTKIGGSLSIVFMVIFVLVMAASFILSTILGVVMALKSGRSRRSAVYCLGIGVALPLAFVLFAILRLT